MCSFRDALSITMLDNGRVKGDVEMCSLCNMFSTQCVLYRMCSFRNALFASRCWITNALRATLRCMMCSLYNVFSTVYVLFVMCSFCNERVQGEVVVFSLECILLHEVFFA